MSGERATYVDSSALVKLVVAEPESAALRRYLRRKRVLASSALARTEVVRAVLGDGPAAVSTALQVLRRFSTVRVSERQLAAAGTLLPPDLRSLHAIHLANAVALEDDLGAVCTYDERMAAAARGLGIRVVAPSRATRDLKTVRLGCADPTSFPPETAALETRPSDHLGWEAETGRTPVDLVHAHQRCR